VRRVLVPAAVAAALTVPFLVALPQSASGAVTPVANPEISDSCGLDLTLVLDASGSVKDAGAVDDVRDASEAFLKALSGTNSQARITQFASLSEQLLRPTDITALSVAPGGAHADALDRYYRPQPQRPSNVNLWQYDGSGDALNDGNYRNYNNSSSSLIWTNWDASLDQVGTPPTGFTLPELVVYITDGRPTAFDFSETSDPKDQGPPPDVAISNSGNPSGSFATQALDRAVLEANDLKKAGSRMLAIGVGTALQNSADRNRLVQIAGPQVVDDGDLSDPDLDINKIDVALVQNFDDLANALRKIVLQLCSPSLTITKVAQTPDDATYQPAQGWDFTVEPFTPLANGKDFRWILPAGGTGATNPFKTVTTAANGTAQFQWEPTNPPEADSRAVISEALEDGYDPGRPGDDNDYRCELRDEDGNVEIRQGDFTGLSFELNPIGQEIVACTVWNSFDYDSEIAITKVNSPTQIRGDLDPPANVTSTFEVTNAGNSALTAVNVTDDKCAPVNYQSGDTGNDGVLPPGFLPDGAPNPDAETWVFTCERDFSFPVSNSPTNVENTGTVTAVDPEGVPVDPKTATDDVDIYTAEIEIVKDASPTEVPRGFTGDIDYSYTVSNLGSLDLDLDKANGVTDDARDPSDPNNPYNAACAPVTYVSGDTNNDDLLQPDETWAFECTSAVTDVQEPLTNLATATGDPQFPDGTAAPPAVKDNDPAVVTVFDANLALNKTVGTQAGVCSTDKSIQVTPGTTVYYCYEITNPGDTALRNPGQVPGPYSPDGWIVDTLGPTGTCGPVAYDSGDDGDGLLAPNNGETWRYFCSKPINQDSINTAVVVAETDTATPQRLIRFSQAEVDVVTPEIAVEKVALRPVVVDPAALEAAGGTLIAGPDSVLPRPAAYTFLVSNPGEVPLADVDLTDTWDQGSCTPSFVSGDDGNGLLDPGEAWEYQCVLNGGPSEGPRLTKADGDQAWQDDGGVGPAPVTDTACVTATSDLDGQPLDEVCSDPQTVLVIQPEIELRKTASPTLVRVGASVTYTFEVENVGDVGLRPLGVFDDKCSPVEYQSGDENGNDILDGPLGDGGSETWTYTCSRAINALGEDENTAQVLATDPLGNTHGSISDATVRTFDPAINLVKEVSDNLVPSGSEVTYTFTVTNTGQSPVQADDVLNPVELVDASDPANPACELPQFVGGDTNNDQALDRTETWTYTCKGVITEETVDLALVGGIAIDGGLVADADLQIVTPFTPAIEIVKTPDKTLLESPGPVTYTYEVKNSGDVPLANVADTITDDKCAPVQYQSGDSDGDGLLDTPNSIFEDGGDETWVFTCTTTISETTLNTVVATGTAVDPEGNGLCEEQSPPAGAAPQAEPVGCEVSATDTALVELLDVGSGVIQRPTELPPLPPTGARFLEALLLGLLLMVMGVRLRTLRFGFAPR